MEPNEILIALFGSAVAASLVTAIFSKAQADKNVKIENIIKQRKIWRDTLRALVEEVAIEFQRRSAGSLISIECRLAVLLNPYDKDDVAIIKSLRQISESWKEESLREFTSRISLLLKHDWERVKKESTTGISFQSLGLASLTVGVAIVILKWKLGLNSVLGLASSVAFFLAVSFIAIGLLFDSPRYPISLKALIYWARNKPFRQRYQGKE